MQNVMLVVAHPDDETIGASTILASVSALVHVTDGAPRDMTDAARHGFTTGYAYAAARRGELAAALRIAGVSPQSFQLGIADQEASLTITEIAEQLRKIIGIVKPESILTHAYEGGHPDHDACSVAVNLAAQDLPVLEFGGYHVAADGQIRTGEFLTGSATVHSVLLNDQQRDQKRRMFECFRTQRDVLQYFPLSCERFRRAPGYEYTKPPHQGELFYEKFSWGMTGTRFRELAAKAIGLC